jgi:hypothetical protein
MQGVPLELRAWAWMDMSGASERMSKSMPGYFQAMLQRGKVSSECAHQIELVPPSPVFTFVHLMACVTCTAKP